MKKINKVNIDVEVTITEDNVVMFDDKKFNINVFMEFVHRIDPDIEYEWLNVYDNSDNFNLIYKDNVLKWNNDPSTYNNGLSIGHYTEPVWEKTDHLCEALLTTLKFIKEWYVQIETSSKKNIFTFTF